VQQVEKQIESVLKHTKNLKKTNRKQKKYARNRQHRSHPIAWCCHRVVFNGMNRQRFHPESLMAIGITVFTRDLAELRKVNKDGNKKNNKLVLFGVLCFCLFSRKS